VASDLVPAEVGPLQLQPLERGSEVPAQGLLVERFAIHAHRWKHPPYPAGLQLPGDQHRRQRVELLAAHGKVATVITLTNGRGNPPWRFGEARVSRDLTSLTIRPCSFTTDRDEIGPGETGKIVVVVDAKAFASSQGLVDLAVQIFRDDGLRSCW
jgi:hypothetical protein